MGREEIVENVKLLITIVGEAIIVCDRVIEWRDVDQGPMKIVEVNWE